MSTELDALLIFPPLWLDLHAAYPALPYLAGFAKRAGYRTMQVDLNKDYLQTLLKDEAFLSSRFERIIAAFDALNRSTALSARHVSEYLELLPLAAFAQNIGVKGVIREVAAHQKLVADAEAEGLFM